MLTETAFAWPALWNRLAEMKWGWKGLVVGLQYGLAAASTINVATICWALGERTVLAWAPNSVVFPGVWALLAVGMHLFGATAVSLRFAMDAQKPRNDGLWNWWKRRLRQEFELCCAHLPAKLAFRSDKTPWFLLMSWFAATCTLAHIIFGVFTFSGMLFIGFGDALKVAIRLMASAVLCRIIVIFELSGMQRVVEVADEGHVTHVPLHTKGALT